MGYTHYFTKKSALTDQQLIGIKLSLMHVIIKSGVDIELTLTSEWININGVGGETHEDFRFGKETQQWECCKTAFKPYDSVVCATLLLLKAILGDGIGISSDGTWDEWKDGRDLFRLVTGENPPYPFDES